MAIAYDAISRGTGSASHTCSGTNRFLVVSSISQSGTSTPTYNGVSLTLLRSETTSQHVHAVYYLVNPASGVNTITCTGGTWVAVSYNGVSQTSPIDSQNSGKANTYTVDVSTTVVGSNCWIVSSTGSSFNSNSYTSQSNRTDRYASAVIQPATPYMNTSIGDSNGTVSTGAQSTTHSESGGPATAYSTSGIDFSISPYVVVNYTITLAYKALTISSFSVGLYKGLHYLLSLSNSTFSYTGNTLSFILDLYTRVTNRVKHATTVTNRTKNAVGSVTNRVKNTTTVTNRPK